MEAEDERNSGETDVSTTTIEWTERTWNPIVGCSVQSPGCTNCYAMRFAGARLDGNPSAPHYAGLTQSTKAGPVWTGKVAMASDRTLTEPLRRRKPTMWFVNSMGDLFHPSVPDAWIDRVFAVMALAPQHTFQVLTKQAKRMREYFACAVSRDGSINSSTHLPGGICTEREIRIRESTVPFLSVVLDASRPISFPLPNVWLGVSVEDQPRANERIPDLLATPAAVRFVSAEPLLGPVDFTKVFLNPFGFTETPRWIIVGGESGPGARPMHPDWARDIRDQCAEAGVPFFFKQWGEWLPAEQRFADGDINLLRKGERPGVFHSWGQTWSVRVGKARAGRLLDGVEHNAMPEVKA